MKVRNIITLTCIAAVGYAMYAMQPPVAESSAMGAARAEEEALAKVPTLQRQAAESIARQIHDQKRSSFMLKGFETRLDVFPENVKELVIAAYYRLYPGEFAPHFESFVPEADTLLTALSDGSYIAYETVERDDLALYDAHVRRWALQEGGFQISQELVIVPLQDTEEFPLMAAASADSQLLAFGYWNSIRIYAKDDNNHFNQIQEIPIDDTRCALSHMALSNGTLVVYQNVDLRGLGAKFDSELAIYNLNAGHNQFVLRQTIAYEAPDLEGITSISFDATGNYFASASHEGTVKMWSRNPVTAQFAVKETLTPDPFADRSFGLVLFSPNSRLIALAQKNRVVIWKMAADDDVITQMQDLHIPDAIINQLSFNHESNRLVAKTRQRQAFRENRDNEFVLWAFDKTTDQWRHVHTQPGRFRSVLFVLHDFMFAENILGEGLPSGTQVWWVPDSEDIWKHILEHTGI